MSARRFVLIRHRDPSGVSGTGQIAEGVVWSDGEIALRWRGPLFTTTIWPHSIDALLAVHGHGGATTIRWLDPEPMTTGVPPKHLASAAAR